MLVTALERHHLGRADMQNWTGVLPEDLPDSRIEAIQNAIVRPPGAGDMRGLRQACGVFGPDGSTIDAARTMSMSGELSLSVPRPTADSTATRRVGSWLFGGMLFHHFGHSLIYSASRLWAVKRLHDEGIELSGVLFFQRHQPLAQTVSELPRNVVTLLETFQPGIPVETVSQIEEVERLYVPQQGISTTANLFIGIPEQRLFYRENAMRIEPNDAPRDIYISRTKTGWKGNHLFEREIERAMAKAGYLVFHPQNVPLAEQIATYRSARRIVAVDGSALHVVAMAVPTEAKVAVLSRREFYAWAIADQIRAFSGCEVHAIEAHKDVYVFSRGLGRRASWSTTQVMTDFQKVGEELTKLGFLDAPPDWQLPTVVHLNQRLADAKAKIGDDLVLIPDSVRTREPYFGSHRKITGEPTNTD